MKKFKWLWSVVNNYGVIWASFSSRLEALNYCEYLNASRSEYHFSVKRKRN